jgi:uncharacterized protein (TIGR00369 family)
MERDEHHRSRRADERAVTTKGIERLESMMAGTYKRSPAAERLSLHFIDGYEPGRIWYERAVDPNFINAQGVLHGGYICSLVDEAAMNASHTLVPDEFTVSTGALTVNFFRPAKEDGGVLRMEAQVINTSRRSYHVECRLTRVSDGKLIAKGAVEVALSQRG